jgi:pSer/pThr/pTyr-binding forkhead associated (FHA) protein
MGRDDNTITLIVTGGPSSGLKCSLTKPRTTIGKAGGGADIEINDHQASVLHRVVGVSEDMVRLYDLDSTNGTYVDDERVESASLAHYSEFRIGSTVFMVTIVSKHLAEMAYQ